MSATGWIADSRLYAVQVGMSRTRLVVGISILVLWVLLVLPTWTVGIGYEANGFRLPSPYRDRPNDIMIFYGPLIASISVLISSGAKIVDLAYTCLGTF